MKKILFVFLCCLLFLRFNGLSAKPKANSDPQGVYKSFASFGYFVDKLQLPIGTKGTIWATPHSIFEGPFHTNSQLRIYLPPGYFDLDPEPFFRGPVSSSASTILYDKNFGPYDDHGKIDPKKFHMIFQDDVQLGVKSIPFPANPMEDAAKGAMGQSPNTTPQNSSFVFLPHDQNSRLTGGIVVNGSLESLIFQKKYEQPFEILLQNQDGQTAVIQVLFKENQTKLKLPNHISFVYQGIPNGALYVKGDIGSKDKGGIEGTVEGRWTVACDGAIFISGNLEYADTPEGDEPIGSDVLALIAHSVFITPRAPQILYLYATIMANMLFVLPSPDVDMPKQGELFWWGNYIGEYPAIMGTFDQDTGEAKDGYDLQKHYDARLSKNPPPFFPEYTVVQTETLSKRK
jgi:hypothetical protein